MLRLPWATARRHCLRSLATSTPPPNDALEQAFGVLTGPDDEHVPANPPQGPAGLLPRGGPSVQPASQQRQSPHGLPPDKNDSIHHLHVVASRNNTILTFTDALGRPCAWVSAGLCGFKKVQRSGYEAGYQCAVQMFSIVAKKREQQSKTMRLHVLFKGFGNGREAFYRALMTTEGDKIRDAVYMLTDNTPVKIGGGIRAKKVRRL